MAQWPGKGAPFSSQLWFADAQAAWGAMVAWEGMADEAWGAGAWAVEDQTMATAAAMEAEEAEEAAFVLNMIL